VTHPGQGSSFSSVLLVIRDSERELPYSRIWPTRVCRSRAAQGQLNLHCPSPVQEVAATYKIRSDSARSEWASSSSAPRERQRAISVPET